jgi:hypothetical protein
MTDDRITTHDAARDLLRYAAPGVHVEVLPVWPPAASARRFRVRLHDVGDLSELDTYSLPCEADRLARRVRDLAAAVHRMRHSR